MLGKSKKKSFDSHFKSAEFPGEVVNSDLCGKLPRSINGNIYFCNFTDQYSRYTHVAGTRCKSDTVELFEDYRSLGHATKFYPKGVKRLHTDGGGEYKNASNVEHTENCPDTPQQNPFSEPMNQTLMEPVRVILEKAGLGAKYW